MILCVSHFIFGLLGWLQGHWGNLYNVLQFISLYRQEGNPRERSLWDVLQIISFSCLCLSFVLLPRKVHIVVLKLVGVNSGDND